MSYTACSDSSCIRPSIVPVRSSRGATPVVCVSCTESYRSWPVLARRGFDTASSDLLLRRYFSVLTQLYSGSIWPYQGMVSMSVFPTPISRATVVNIPPAAAPPKTPHGGGLVEGALSGSAPYERLCRLTITTLPARTPCCPSRVSSGPEATRAPVCWAAIALSLSKTTDLLDPG